MESNLNALPLTFLPPLDILCPPARHDPRPPPHWLHGLDTTATRRKDQQARAAPLSGKATPTNAQRQWQQTSIPGPPSVGGRYCDHGIARAGSLAPAQGFAFNTPAPDHSVQRWENYQPLAFSGGPTLLSHSFNLGSSGKRGTPARRLACVRLSSQR